MPPVPSPASTGARRFRRAVISSGREGPAVHRVRVPGSRHRRRRAPTRSGCPGPPAAARTASSSRAASAVPGPRPRDELGHPQPGAVPGHLRLVPLDPGQVEALGAHGAPPRNADPATTDRAVAPSSAADPSSGTAATSRRTRAESSCCSRTHHTLPDDLQPAVAPCRRRRRGGCQGYGAGHRERRGDTAAGWRTPRRRVGPGRRPARRRRRTRVPGTARSASGDDVLRAVAAAVAEFAAPHSIRLVLQPADFWPDVAGGALGVPGRCGLRRADRESPLAEHGDGRDASGRDTGLG